MLGGCGHDSHFVAMELAEYNPLRDFGGHTAQAAIELACAVMAPDVYRHLASMRAYSPDLRTLARPWSKSETQRPIWGYFGENERYR